jgi:purine-binding chemotaxis protein CheW
MTEDRHPTSDRITDPAEIQRILEERTAALARTAEEEDLGETISLVVLALGAERYAVNIDFVREIRPVETLTQLPATPVFWLGLVNLRGNLSPVLDLRRYLGVQATAAAHDAAQLVVVESAGVSIALKVDDVPEVRVVPVASIGPSLVEASSERPDLQIGLTDDLLSVLDVEALLDDPSLIIHDEID